MAINLATKYSDQIAEVFTRASFIKGKTAETFDLTGVKTLKVYTPITVEEVDYDRDGGLKRYGDVTEMQDVVQELTMTQDKAFTLTIDKGNNLDQNLVKNAADMLRLQLNEKSTPAADKYAFQRFVTMAGTLAESEKPTKSDIISKIADASQALDDALVPDDNRYLYLTSEMYKLVCTSDEFAGVDVLARQSIAKGVCGEVFGMNVVRVPKSYLPENVYFLVTHKDAVLMPYKIADAKVHEDPVGVSGALIEGRHYYDAYVLGAKCGGVYALVASGSISAAPSISGKKITGTGTIRYTLDGSDPRYSDSAKDYVAETELTAEEGCQIRAFATEEGKYPSPVAAG
ncbi:FN3 associated domain-containing protein [uncultured Agathobaculum sp.]|uniref:FN3 associated domain-containing protein n=1 Tax=uncultured Agathobaculum sp. TaxID=2048140 RepID=UPI003208BEF4